MKIILSKYAGFCDGVQRAYEIVQKIAKDKNTKKPVFVRGSLVHNQDVVKKIESLGIKRLNFDGNVKDFFRLNRGRVGTLVVTAHGIGPDFYSLAEKNGIKIVDTTCPKVIKVQRLAKLYADKNYQVIIIGEKKHKEVKGIYEWSGKTAMVIDNKKDFNKIRINPRKKIAVISQTTQKRNLFKSISKAIKEKYPKATIHDTLCLTTHNRQQEIFKIAQRSDVVIVIGSSKSNNSVHLWEIAKEVNPNSYFVEGIKDIKKEWFKKCEKIGVSAGASTPSWIIEEVCSFLANKL